MRARVAGWFANGRPAGNPAAAAATSSTLPGAGTGPSASPSTRQGTASPESGTGAGAATASSPGASAGTIAASGPGPSVPAAGTDSAASAGSNGGPHTPPPASRAPSDSWLEMLFPFSSNAVLREQYQRFMSNSMRYGLLLEDLDTLAGDIAARHAGVRDRVLLTASIDRISWLQDPEVGEVTLSHDLRMAGQVVWAGRSSMEVLIELSRRECSQQAWTFIGLARFVLVARTPDRTAAADVPALVPQSDRERELFEQGQKHMQLRNQRRDTHTARKPPTVEEVALVHDLIRNHHLARTLAAHHHHHSPRDSPDAVPMARTELQSSVLMHSQDRNAFDVIFGGHLLRLAYEHAFATAALHAGEYCDPLSMDDVAFLLPVPIGTLLRLTGQVVYVEGPVVRVHVRATKLEPGAPEQSVVTNVFSFAFVSKSGGVRRVVPETMVEAMEYLMGYRQHVMDDTSRVVAEERVRPKL
ncbi:hypothetical protein HXX76_006899 [Chlamydomonas incerta]|uniref:HotDog ACOT-type domain-containing protein n=1 Tax=Chlamydomonas incerta TaxID=51695 RepID=A0A835W1D8_CHLIN|nr:hypothetical protein HXX76_006899 [Chlamydomonas incerta]|eukprot:KAG2435700.1 hypothetical protein HXX76_006899 [Chlamydomonas incerta]